MSSENGVDDEKRPAQEEELEDDVYEIISSGVQDKTYWGITVRRLGELDLSRRPVYEQLGVGGFTGW
ncbi:Hypothetical predicted protein [Paramuricea clavata]|uniref:Uncharacterized protein n=1 Tax=Paramuricea clavata TaxID=317549 RepID=A0A6S7G2P2_PARCT|nr:Hypothetical predicted protein [Paramuricea clavata]